MHYLRPAICVAAAAVLATALAATASASQLIDRNASNVTLQTNAKREALITYTVHGVTKHVLAWDAINAVPPTPGRTQVAFKLDRAGGWGKYHDATYWETSFKGGCIKYDGPGLPFLMAACKAQDGTYWALQQWQRELPDYGVKPSAMQASRELRLSHWSGAIPVLSIEVDWAYHKFDQLFGTYKYGGLGVYGFRSTSSGVPLDSFGRNIYVDTFDSALGTGWKRDNSFLTHAAGKGSFCYGFYPHGSHPAAAGTHYRAIAEGPGVAPDVMWQGTSPGPYNADADATANAQLRALADPSCKPN